MAGFTALGIGLALGMIGSKAASKLKQPKPGATADQGIQAQATERPEPIDAQRRSSEATSTATQMAQRIRRRARGNTGITGGLPRRRAALGAPTASAQVEPRSLIGY